MAAYSAVAVFRHTLEQLLGSEQFPPHVSKSQITFLHENVCSLQSSLEKIPLVPKSKGEKMKDLQTRIREAIYAAQDEVDYWVRGHSPHEMTMKKLEVDIQLVEKDAADMEQETRDAQDVLAEDPVLVSDSFKISGRDKIVGHEEDFKTVIDCVQSEVDALVDLIGRNLIAISEKSSNGGIKVCRMQNSLRQLAEIESGKEKFFHCRKKYNQILEEGMKKQRRVSVHINLLMSLEEVYEATKTITSARTLLYLGPHHHHPLPYCLTFDLLKVLDAFTVYFVEFPDEFFQLVHLTYLSLTYNDELPPEISLLQKLQVLMVRRKPKLIFIGVSFLPDEIWEMPELRHLWFTEIDFPALPQNIPQNKALLLNLQTLSYINAASCTRDVLRRMPSLKKLSVWAEAPGVIGLYLDELEQLEAFKFTVLHPSPNKQVEFEPEISFPQTLRKLSLSGCGLRWDAMEVVAALPNLEVLKLRELAFNGEEWCLENHCVFEKLKFMLIEYLNFKRWSADHTHFPGLERLYLRHCYELEEIPSDIGFIGTLGLIELVDCSPQAVESAEVIKQEQEVDGGRQGFQVRIYCSYE
ncbi:hypothetical protein SASPL_134129 [Salvia splendens]|uniref:Disease resistance R13L4/SHOC-2-like LRR domain-containing protein n=1 Tax=Salvia splendens TaxID=180675 RepID=A0A8X8X4B0_SALSN|nr:hypothetical protein SASPL_134129 [Salvia splendens]